MNAIFHRVSIRKYQDKPVEEEKIIKMLRAAMAAPSARNQQPWEYYVITNEEIKEKLSTVTPYSSFTKAAPLVFVACYRDADRLPSPDFAHIDMSASVENLLLEADELGLGAVWMGIAPRAERMADVAEIIGLPDNLSVFCLIACGYPGETRMQEDRYDESRVHYLK